MAMIYYSTLNKDIKRNILAKNYTEEQLKEIYESLKVLKAKKIKSFKLAVIIVVVVMIIVGWTSFDSMGFSEVFIYSLGSTAFICLAALLLGWFCSFGILKIQFSRAVKKAYPECIEEFKLL